MKLKAWTVGSGPSPILEVSTEERRTVSDLFREQCKVWHTFWHDMNPTRDVLRTFWRRARFDAHASHRF